MRGIRACACVMLCAAAAWPAIGRAQPWPPGPSRTLAFTQYAPAVLSEADISLRPADGSPPYQLTVDARAVQDAVEDVKLPVGWVGNNVLAFATASGQQAAQEPLYFQRIDSPRRVDVDNYVIGAAPAPAGATVAVLGEGQHLFMHLVDAATLRKIVLPLPGDKAQFTTYGDYPLVWSADGTRIATGWRESNGLRIAVCTVLGRCISAFHRDDIGLASISVGWSFAIGWLSTATLLLAVAPALGGQSGSLVTLPAANLGAHASPAVARGTRLGAGQVLAVSVAPTGDYAALIETPAANKTPLVQVARISGGALVPGASITATGEAGVGSVVTGASFAFAAPSQAWDGHAVFYSESYYQGQASRPTQAIVRADAATGTHAIIQTDGYWVAIQPSGPAVTSIGRGQGSCPNPPDAVTVPGTHFGFSAKTSVQETVAYYRTLRRQAFRLDDGSCLGTVMSGTALAANKRAIGQLKSGESGVVPSAVKPMKIQLDLTTGIATEVATVQEGLTVYRGGTVVSTQKVVSATATYHLKLRSLGKVNGFPVSRWMVTAVSGG